MDKPKPTIAELEAILNGSEKKLEILPNGEIKCCSGTEESCEKLVITEQQRIEQIKSILFNSGLGKISLKYYESITSSRDEARGCLMVSLEHLAVELIRCGKVNHEM